MTTPKTEEPCIICQKPVPDYDPNYCCNGRECGCGGQPMDPCVCSIECENAVFAYIGMSMGDRRIKAGIELWKL